MYTFSFTAFDRFVNERKIILFYLQYVNLRQ